MNETSTPVGVRKKFWSFFAQAGAKGAVNDKDHNKPLDLWSEAYLVSGHIPGNGSDSTGTTPLWTASLHLLVFICFPPVSKYITQGQTKDRETFKKRGGRKSGREEGRRELREMIILFNHILDGSQVVCGTESKTERVSEERSVRETMWEGGGRNGWKEPERGRRWEGDLRRGREVMSLRAEPLEAVWSAAALKQEYQHSSCVSVCVCTCVCVCVCLYVCVCMCVWGRVTLIPVNAHKCWIQQESGVRAETGRDPF